VDTQDAKSRDNVFKPEASAARSQADGQDTGRANVDAKTATRDRKTRKWGASEMPADTDEQETWKNMTDSELTHETGMDNIRARRNHLVAHWAAAKMGMDDDTKKHYGTALHKADHEEPGDADILRKLAADMTARGTRVDQDEIARVISECHKRALRETHSTD
jgi:hypothetical protein